MSESEEKKRKLSEIKKEKELEIKKKQKIFDEEFEKSQNYIGQLDDEFSDWHRESNHEPLKKWTKHSKLAFFT